MKKLVSLFVFSCLTASLTAFLSIAHADYDLLIKNNCLACHSVDKRKYGPKLNDISLKYANESMAAELLAKKIKLGGSGVWGLDVMPPQPLVSDADALVLSKYILSLK